ncbi:MAG: hypothetical protein IJC86_03115 [Clostridia bacterium]|nr:hypothetical protein [Clostridia bacterium]
MTEKVVIPYNDVFFYGLALRDRENPDVRQDIFANILMRYLRTLVPASNRLYRTTKNSKYEYSYSFIPTKPLRWRVIKNRRIVQDIEQLSDGKYCVNYYDDNGNDVKRIHFSKQHKWLKTNYYNNIYGNDLICSIVPKELNGQTVVLMYPTGATYPKTLHICPVPSNDVVQQRVFSRVPEPELMALTNYGVLFFTSEENLNIYNQVMSEEEKKYAEEIKPPVYTTEEDVAGGFRFDVNSFDSTKSGGSVFDLSEAEELTEDGFKVSSVNRILEETDVVNSEYIEEPHDDIEDEYSIDSEIAQAIKVITEMTDVHIDNDIVFSASADSSEQVTEIDAAPEKSEPADELPLVNDISAEPVEDSESDLEELSNLFTDAVETEESSDDTDNTSTDEESDIEPDSSYIDPSFLNMNDEDIDDYVRSLIDSMMLDAKEAASEYTAYNEEGFVSGSDESAVETNNNIDINSSSDYVDSNPSDSVIESNGAKYFYYGDVDENGKRNGHGKTLMENGNTAYDGDYKADMRHGIGSFYYKDGSLCYWGNWQNNLRNGFGVGVNSETGIVHTGSWKDNKPTGVGVRFDNNGKFMYIDSACENVNGGIRITGFAENTFTVEFWDEKSLRTIKKEISVDDLLK